MSCVAELKGLDQTGIPYLALTIGHLLVNNNLITIFVLQDVLAVIKKHRV